MEFYSTTKKNENLSSASKWMASSIIKNIILSEVSQVQKAKGHMFFLLNGK
jgi:hypothetical protein